MLKFIKSKIQKLSDILNDFSDRGFIKKCVEEEPEKVFTVTKIWIDKVGWSQGIKMNVVRCYSNGFSFWRGQIKDGMEWYCSYDSIEKFYAPLGIKSASPLMTLKAEKGEIDCMLGEAADYIQEKCESKKAE